MKKLIYIIFCIPFIVSCKKDNSIPADHRRIKEVIISNDADAGTIKIYYTYNDNLLVNRTVVVKSNSSYDTYDTTIKCNYSYSGNIVTALLYLGDDEGGLYLGEKVEYEFTKKRMDRMKYFEYMDGQWISRSEYFFKFDGDLLKSFDYYSDLDEGGVLYKISLGEYIYNDQNATRFRVKDLYYDEYFYNEDFEYENGLLASWSSSENYRLTNYWNNLDKENYSYNSENVLEKTRVYEWHNYWSFNFTITFEYDHQNLVMEDYGVGKLHVEYIYENGMGNSEQLVSTPMDKVYNNPIIENIYKGLIKDHHKLGYRNIEG